MFSLFVRSASSPDLSQDIGSQSTTSKSRVSREDPMDSTRSSGSTSTTLLPPQVVAIAGLPETKKLVIRDAVNKLFNTRYFDICTVRDILDALGRSQNTTAFKLLKTLHCMNYEDMSEELRERLPKLLSEALAPKNKNTVTEQVINNVFPNY